MRGVGVCVLAMVFLGCGTTDAESDVRRPTTRDSAGVRIVENPAPVWREREPWQGEERVVGMTAERPLNRRG